MTAIPFTKFHGFGNDYIVIERRNVPEGLNLSDLARAICHRHTGVGADGIAVLMPTGNRSDRTNEYSPGADYYCEIINPDGSIAGFSGNGTRCAAAHLHHLNIWAERTLKLETLSGIKSYKLIERVGDSEFWFDAEIGQPEFASDLIPVLIANWRETVVDEPIVIDGQTHLFSAVNVGNPVACVFVNSFDFDWRSLGSSMEVHETFPQKVNVVFIKVNDLENIEIRIWERAAGETSSSGTCSSAAAVMSAFTRRTGRNVDVKAEGGVTKVTWREDGEIVIRGRADFAFQGEWLVR